MKIVPVFLDVGEHGVHNGENTFSLAQLVLYSSMPVEKDINVSLSSLILWPMEGNIGVDVGFFPLTVLTRIDLGQ